MQVADVTAHQNVSMFVPPIICYLFLNICLFIYLYNMYSAIYTQLNMLKYATYRMIMQY